MDTFQFLLSEIFLSADSLPLKFLMILTEKFSEYLKSPNITVIVIEANSSEYLNRVRVTGAVQQNLSTHYRPGMTILDLVLDAGGINDFANPKKTKLHRKDGTTFKIQLDEILYSGNLSSNYYLQPGRYYHHT